jgi:hypothetical protein
MHCTFGTKQRFPSIEPELESRLWPYKWEKPLPIFKSRKSIIAGKPFKEFKELLERHGIEYDRRYLFANE